MKTRMKSAAAVLVLAVVVAAGCTQIPLFNPKARLVNQADSGLEAVTELNNFGADLRDDGLITQQQLSSVAPQIDRAEAIFLSVRRVARVLATQPSTQPTTQPLGTISEAKAILQSVRAALEQMRKGKT